MVKESKAPQFLTARGARKKASASLWFYEKTKAPVIGLVVNGLPSREYFAGVRFGENKILRPLQVCNVLGKYAASIKVFGGGKDAQVEAVSLALARALVKKDESFKPILRREGLLTRDSRMVESKKWGHHGARRGQQFSKR